MTRKIPGDESTPPARICSSGGFTLRSRIPVVHRIAAIWFRQEIAASGSANLGPPKSGGSIGYQGWIRTPASDELPGRRWVISELKLNVMVTKSRLGE